MRCKQLLVIMILCLLGTSTPARATDIIQIDQKNYQAVVPEGKEVDAIYGDWVLRNDKLTAIIARPIPGRNANMTVRGVSGMLIDLTSRYFGSDQLSCFYPTSGRYLYEDEEAIQFENQGKPLNPGDKRSGKGPFTIYVRGKPLVDNGTAAKIGYTLRDGQDWLEYSVEIVNNSDQPRAVLIEDGLRCDGNLFKTDNDAASRLFYAEDLYFGQCYGFQLAEGNLKREGGRMMQLRLSENAERVIAPGARLQWSGKIFCSQGLPGVRSLALASLNDAQARTMMLKLQSPQGAIAHAVVELQRDGQSLGSIQTDDKGTVRASLLPGNYTASIQSHGRPTQQHPFEIAEVDYSHTLSLPAASRLRAKITDADGKPIAAKVQFIGVDGTSSPDFGPDSGIYAIHNAVYCAHGQFEQAINAGRYRVIISHGPEYDAESREMLIADGQLAQLTCSLPRTVDTSGWISSDFHSHSSPSGDNVSHQTGRVLNLLAEHIEFAPCTEHNRIDSYADDLELLKATSAMATCTGMELTGSPLPINHQNAFPMQLHVHEQDGGGPRTDEDPVKQIERLALWDNAASKVVQTNHPNIPQILGDRDLNGQPDDGFRGMLGWMDVMEIHPPEGIFTPPTSDLAPNDKRTNPTFYWLQLLNLGYRISGVVNTDSHYNFHGSGWLRNYMQCSTDEPAQISVDEMIHSAEHGHMVMSTGPFLQVELRLADGQRLKTYTCGDDVPIGTAASKLWIKVQCPNWFDINRVQVFANGRPLEALNFTRKSHPQLFGRSAIRFEHEIQLAGMTQDTHLIVATIGEGLKLGPVMGEKSGELPPVAVSNPIFLDTDGSGFQPNGDDLGVPFMLPESPQLKN